MRTVRVILHCFSASGHMYDTTQVDIDVLDVNDNAPDFIRPLFVGGKELPTPNDYEYLWM